VSQPVTGAANPIAQLRKEWDFGRAAVQRCHGAGSALDRGGGAQWHVVDQFVGDCGDFFFVPTAMVINELSSGFRKKAGYMLGQGSLWRFSRLCCRLELLIYTVFYFPGLLLASAAMSAYIIGEGGGTLAQDRTFLLLVRWDFCWLR